MFSIFFLMSVSCCSRVRGCGLRAGLRYRLAAAAAAAARDLRASAADVLDPGIEVRIDQQIGDVIDLRLDGLVQLVGGGDGDDAFVDGVRQLARAGLLENDVQHLGELNIVEGDGHGGGGLVDAVGFEGLPAHQDIRPGDIAEVIDGIAEGMLGNSTCGSR